MEKLIVVFSAPLLVGNDPEQCVAALRAASPHCRAVTLHIHSDTLNADSIAGGGYDATLRCALSLWVDRVESVQILAPLLASIGGNYSVYSVVESVPVEYPRLDWKEGAASPGVTLLALLRRRADLSEAEFFRRWLGHTALSADIHPLTRYHRNAVLRRVATVGTEPAQDWHAIVEERVGCIEDMRPERFYRGTDAAARALADLLGFVDVANGDMRCALLREYIVKKPPWL